jgi:hypothetical protein
MSDEIWEGGTELKLLPCGFCSVSFCRKYGVYSVSVESYLLSASCKIGELHLGPSSAGGLLWSAISNFYISCCV